VTGATLCDMKPCAWGAAGESELRGGTPEKTMEDAEKSGTTFEMGGSILHIDCSTG